MKVKDLINVFQKFDENLDVYIGGGNYIHEHQKFVESVRERYDMTIEKGGGYFVVNQHGVYIS